ncbi:MAG: oligoribonuclease [Candidatus Saccharibacteria bacterium]|nr:oligoribonuclease [Candidatus Saccharibacteria bacterium]
MKIVYTSYMTKKAKILWVDLEMTGLDPVEDRILEVGAIVTDWDFNEIATYEAAVKVGPKLFESRIKAEPDFWNKFPEVRDALIAQNDSDVAKGGRTVENELLEFVAQHFDADERIILAGNSIHQDRKFIDNEWSRLAKLLHYRMLDVSAWKVVFDGKYNKRFAKPEQHRAIDDIRGSIMELKYYLGKVHL